MRLAWERLQGRNAHEAGLALLETLYREETGSELPPIEKTLQGKPYFPNAPFHFSISHTPYHIFCCISKYNVGIDAEEIGRNIDPALKERFCSISEQARVNSNDDLLRLWVLKESYAKLTGRGLGNYLRQTNFYPDDPRIQTIDGCYMAVLTEERN